MNWFFKNLLFIYLSWLCWVLVAACGIFSCGMHAGSSSPTRYRTLAPCTGSAESYPLDYQGSPERHFFLIDLKYIALSP